MHDLDHLKAVCLRNSQTLLEVGNSIAIVLQEAERLEAAGEIPEQVREHWNSMRNVVRTVGGLVATMATDFVSVNASLGSDTVIDRTRPGAN